MTGLVIHMAQKMDLQQQHFQHWQQQPWQQGASGAQAGQTAEPAGGPCAADGVHTASTQQQQPLQQPRQSSSSSSRQQAGPQTEQPLHTYSQFGLTAGTVNTVPRLLHLFEKGWAPDAAPSQYIYQALSQSKYTGDIKRQRVQWDNMLQGYKLLQRLSAVNSISTEQAAAVVEFWRLGKKAAYVLPDGSVTAADAAEAQRIKNLLSNAESDKVLGLDAVVKEARNLDFVQETKNQKRAAAGRAGGVKSGAVKRQRREEASSDS